MEASELFFGLCRYYSSLGLDDDIPWSIWTQRSLSYFDQLGRMLGYVVVTEDTLTNQDDWKCPKKLKGKRIDMVWFYPDKDDYALALEHEGSNSVKRIGLDIKKLSVILGLRVLVVYRQNTLRIQRLIAKEVVQVKDHGNPFLLLNIPDYFRDEPPIEKLESRLINDKGKLVAVGTAEARRESITGLRFFARPKWISKR
jgi:hypothetical protein